MYLEELIELLNEWWKTESVEKEKIKEYRRKAFFELKNLLDLRQIIILTGLRRVGKTTLMFQLIDELLEEVNSRNIFYYSFDEKRLDLLEILKVFQKLTKTNWKKEKVFIFLDEIHKLKDWSSQLKIIYDNFPKIKFIVSGSASVMLEKEAISNLAGRYFLKEIPTLSIKEYFELKNKVKIENYELYKSELEVELEDYFKKPFPEIVEWKSEGKIFEYIKETVISKIIRVDLPDVFKNVNTELLQTLLDIFFSEPGLTLNLDSLSKTLRTHKSILQRHVYFLEFSKLIRILKNFRISILSASRKLKKVYPYDISLAFPFNPKMEIGKVAECVVCSRINARNYWKKNGKEVDFIFKNEKTVPIEVKAKVELEKNDLKWVDYLIKKFKLRNGIVIYLGETRKFNEIKGVNILDFLFKETQPQDFLSFCNFSKE